MVTAIALWFILVRLFPGISTQRTFQRGCDCDSIIDGKCAYTILLPSGSGSGGGSCDTQTMPESVKEALEMLRNKTNMLFEIGLEQSALLNKVQGSLLALQQSCLHSAGFCYNTSQDPADNTTLQNRLVTLEEMTRTLTRNLTEISALLSQKLTEVLSLQMAVNQTSEGLRSTVVQNQIQDAQLSQLTETVRLLRKATCLRRGPLFTGDDKLNNTRIQVSSSYENNAVIYGPLSVAIDYIPPSGQPGSWCPSEPNVDEWVEFDIGRPVMIFDIATRGRPDYSQWVETFSVQYVPVTYNGTSMANDTRPWTNYTDIVGATQIFVGNSDGSSIKLNTFWRPIFTEFLRILPQTGYNKGNKCMRAELVGCLDET